MFKRSFGGKDRAGKARKISKRSFRDDAKARMREALNDPAQQQAGATPDTSPSIGSAGASPRLNSAIVTICVGKDQRKCLVFFLSDFGDCRNECWWRRREGSIEMCVAVECMKSKMESGRQFSLSCNHR